MRVKRHFKMGSLPLHPQTDTQRHDLDDNDDDGKWQCRQHSRRTLIKQYYAEVTNISSMAWVLHAPLVFLLSWLFMAVAFHLAPAQSTSSSHEIFYSQTIPCFIIPSRWMSFWCCCVVSVCIELVVCVCLSLSSCSAVLSCAAVVLQLCCNCAATELQLCCNCAAENCSTAARISANSDCFRH